ncbi:MAG: hypothetical protein NC548_23380 [Lachnospiraceae bacterium]|nr:hypothetical protein [Lachnospiraceae bacterium]
MVDNSTDLQYTYMNGQEVYKFAVTTVPASIKKVVENAGFGAGLTWGSAVIEW